MKYTADGKISYVHPNRPIRLASGSIKLTRRGQTVSLGPVQPSRKS